MSELHYDKNTTKIVIPNGTKCIPSECFINFDKLEEIIIPNSVEHIGNSAFIGCKALRKVNLPNSLKTIEPLAFSECESLEEIIIPSSLQNFSHGIFSYCYNLKTVISHDEINYIDDLAFYNCKNLENFVIPKNTTSIGRMAFMGCDKIKEINIPKKTTCIETGAFSLMSSLEKITVDIDNTCFFTSHNDTVLISKDGLIIQYAINSNNEQFIGDCKNILNNSMIYNISDFAFAGAKKLKKIFFGSEIQSIGSKTFMGCDNLKDLEIYHTKYVDSLLVSVFNINNEECEIPFENIVIGEGIKMLCENLSELFKNAKNIVLPESLEYIGTDDFSKSKSLRILKLPNNLKEINSNTFHPNIEINLPTVGSIKGENFNTLETKTSADYYIKTKNKGNIKVISLKDGTYYIKIDNYDLINISRNEIKKLSNNSHFMINNPDDLIIYLINLLTINGKYNSIMKNIWTDSKLKNIFDKFFYELNYRQDISSHKVSKVIREIIENSGQNDEVLFSSIMMKNINKEDIIEILKNYNPSADRFFRLAPYNQKIELDTNKLIKYFNFLEKYKKYDKFLYNPIFIQKLSEENQELLLKNFNKNIKHLLKSSHTLNDFYGENLNDFLAITFFILPW